MARKYVTVDPQQVVCKLETSPSGDVSFKVGVWILATLQADGKLRLASGISQINAEGLAVDPRGRVLLHDDSSGRDVPYPAC